MNTEFMTADTNLPPCLPLPGAMLGLPVSSTAKVMYAKLLGAVLTAGVEDANGILFVRFPLAELAVALGRSTQTCKRALRELEAAGLILRVRQGIGAPNRIYVLVPNVNFGNRATSARTFSHTLTENQPHCHGGQPQG